MGKKKIRIAQPRNNRYLATMIVVVFVTIMSFPVFADVSVPSDAGAVLARGEWYDPSWYLPEGYAYAPLGDTALQMLYTSTNPMTQVKQVLQTSFSVSVDGRITGATISNLNNSTQFNSAISKLGSITIGLKTLALVFAVTFFFVGLANDFVNGQAYGEIALKKIAVLVATIAIIYGTPYIVFQIFNIGNELMNKLIMSDGSAALVETYGTIVANFSELVSYNTKLGPLKKGLAWISGMSEAFSLIILTIVPWFLTKASIFGLRIVAYTRAAEMLLVGAFSPFGVALHPYDHGESTKRFFKQVAALALQGAIILAGLWILSSMRASFNLLTFDSKSNIFSGLIDGAVLSLAMFGFAAKSRGIANAIVGL